MEDLYKYENELYDKGLKYIGGVDEVGRGPLIGSVVAACVVLPRDFKLDGLTDSKKLSEKKRDEFYNIIREKAIAIGIGIVDEKKIDEINIYEASRSGMVEAIKGLSIVPDYILTDAMPLYDFFGTPIEPLIKGDAKAQCIAAASILAKVTRDRIMDELDKEYPQYKFKKHKGYPTKEHLELLEKYGPIKEHYRYSYGPVKKFL